MDSANLGNLIRQIVRSMLKPPCREARVVRVRPSGVLEAKIRSLTGDGQVLPVRGYEPRWVQGEDGPEILDAVRGDTIWVSEDEGGQLVMVGTFEPRG